MVNDRQHSISQKGWASCGLVGEAWGFVGLVGGKYLGVRALR